MVGSLLIDIGNTRTKIRLHANDSDSKDFVVASSVDALREFFSSHEWLIDRVYCVKVASVNCSVLSETIHGLFSNSEVVDVEVTNEMAQLSLCYQDVSKLGVDRWLAMLGVIRLGYATACVFDFGTAITCDVFINKSHQGGLITPGVDTMRDSLASNTVQLPRVDQANSVLLAKDTLNAIGSGTMYAAIGFVEAVVGRLIKSHTEDIPVFLTGGNAQALASHLPGYYILKPDLVLLGMEQLLDNQ